VKGLGHIIGALFLIWLGCQVLGYMGNHGMIGPAPPAATTPASDSTGEPDCLAVPADGQSHPCQIPDPPVMHWTVVDHGTYQADGDCWSLGMSRGNAFMRTCVSKADYGAHPLGSTYTTGGPGSGLSGGTAGRITDGS
jgi:hypothetical protein